MTPYPNNGKVRRWVSKYPVKMDDDTLIDEWLTVNNNWFIDPQNGFFGMKEQFRALAKFQLENGKHGPDYGNHRIIKAQNYWDKWVECFMQLEEYK